MDFPEKTFRKRAALTALIAIGLAVPSFAQTDHFHPKGKPPSEHTKELLREARTGLPFDDTRDFDEYRKGFIAAPDSRIIKADAGHNASSSSPRPW
jgi:alkyl sulfatase BDS1-like metallo-beta-lactamase superfamily hydrolase